MKEIALEIPEHSDIVRQYEKIKVPPPYALWILAEVTGVLQNYAGYEGVVRYDKSTYFIKDARDNVHAKIKLLSSTVSEGPVKIRITLELDNLPSKRKLEDFEKEVLKTLKGE